jgi:adenosine deaminase
MSRCLRTPQDLELLADEFFAGQAEQNIRYSEVTYTPYNQYRAAGIPFDEQMDALHGALQRAQARWGIRAGWIMDIPRDVTAEEGLLTADWAVAGMNRGVVALGLGGDERGNPPERFAESFERTRAAGLPCILHAGETVGAESIWGALRFGSLRIGHGVRCLESPALVEELRRRQIPLEVCPTSNVCLGVVPDLQSHPLPRLLAEGLVVTINSDDPPMFNTSLTQEYERCMQTFGFDLPRMQEFVRTAARASLLPAAACEALLAELHTTP